MIEDLIEGRLKLVVKKFTDYQHCEQMEAAYPTVSEDSAHPIGDEWESTDEWCQSPEYLKAIQIVQECIEERWRNAINIGPNGKELIAQYFPNQHAVRLWLNAQTQRRLADEAFLAAVANMDATRAYQMANVGTQPFGRRRLLQQEPQPRFCSSTYSESTHERVLQRLNVSRESGRAH